MIRLKRWMSGFSYPYPGMNGTQGLMVFIIGAVNLLRGLSYFFDSPIIERFPAALVLLHHSIPFFNIQFWGALWAINGLIALVYAFRFHDTVATSFIALAYAGWGLSYLCGWFLSVYSGGSSRDYILFTVYMVFVCFMLFWGGRRKGT